VGLPAAYKRALDLLTNAKPVYAVFYGFGRALISTSAELVGEEETSPWTRAALSGGISRF
jgi:hypothetical protein